MAFSWLHPNADPQHLPWHLIGCSLITQVSKKSRMYICMYIHTYFYGEALVATYVDVLSGHITPARTYHACMSMLEARLGRVALARPRKRGVQKKPTCSTSFIRYIQYPHPCTTCVTDRKYTMDGRSPCARQRHAPLRFPPPPPPPSPQRTPSPRTNVAIQQCPQPTKKRRVK